MKPLSFSDYKKLQKMSYNQVNFFLKKFYEDAFNDGCEYGQPLSDDEIFRVLRSEKIGVSRADRIIKKLFGEWDEGY